MTEEKKEPSFDPKPQQIKVIHKGRLGIRVVSRNVKIVNKE